MSRKGISKLKRPERQYDPAHSTERADGEIDFETLKAAKAEDRTRAKSTKKAGMDLFDEDDTDLLDGHGFVDPLTRKLLLASKGVRVDSPASQVSMRNPRRAIAGGLWKLHEQYGLDERFFVLMPKCWEVPSDELLDFDVRRVKKAFRAQLEYFGAGEADGYMFAGIDTEFYAREKVFRIHYQGIAAAGMMGVVDKVRNCRKFKPTGASDTGKKRTVLRMEKVYDRPRPYTYCVKSAAFENSYWCADREMEIRSRPRRIPDPHLAIYLKWLDQWSLEDLTMMVGLRVEDEGLVYRHRESKRIRDEFWLGGTIV